MKQWYYSKSGEQQGPVSEAELRQRLDSHAIPPSTLVWAEGQAGWVAASTLPEFAPSPYAAPQSDEGAPLRDWSGYAASGPQVRPWIRYWAKTLDILLFSVFAGFILGFIYPELLEISDTLFGMLALVCYVLVEPVMLSTFGTTPVRALLKVRVRHQDGSRLSFKTAMVRTLKVWLRGLGLGIPLIAFFTHLTSYSRLTKDGITSWDAEGGLTVSHQHIEWWRWLLLICLLGGFIYLMVLGSEA